MTEPIILRCQCTLSKWNCRTTYQRPPGTDEDFNAVCHEQVEENDSHMPLAVRYEACQRRGQRNAKEGQGPIATGEILRRAHEAEAPPLSHVWVPYLRARQRATEWVRGTQMEATISTWRLSCPIAKPRLIGGKIHAQGTCRHSFMLNSMTSSSQ